MSWLSWAGRFIRSMIRMPGCFPAGDRELPPISTAACEPAWGHGTDRHAAPLILLKAEGSSTGACSQCTFIAQRLSLPGPQGLQVCGAS